MGVIEDNDGDYIFGLPATLTLTRPVVAQDFRHLRPLSIRPKSRRKKCAPQTSFTYQPPVEHVPQSGSCATGVGFGCQPDAGETKRPNRMRPGGLMSAPNVRHLASKGLGRVSL